MSSGTVTTADEALRIALAAQRILRLMIAGRNRDAEFYSYIGECLLWFLVAFLAVLGRPVTVSAIIGTDQ